MKQIILAVLVLAIASCATGTEEEVDVTRVFPRVRQANETCIASIAASQEVKAIGDFVVAHLDYLRQNVKSFGVATTGGATVSFKDIRGALLAESVFAFEYVNGASVYRVLPSSAYFEAMLEDSFYYAHEMHSAERMETIDAEWEYEYRCAVTNATERIFYTFSLDKEDPKYDHMGVSKYYARVNDVEYRVTVRGSTEVTSCIDHACTTGRWDNPDFRELMGVELNEGLQSMGDVSRLDGMLFTDPMSQVQAASTKP